MRFRFHDDKSKQALRAYIDKCPQGREYEAVITMRVKRRTLSQNRLYWLYIACIMDETGENDREALHNYLRRKFLPVHRIMIGSEEAEKLTSTTELNTGQFTRYIDSIVVWAASELGIALPDPEDLHFEQFCEQYKHWL